MTTPTSAPGITFTETLAAPPSNSTVTLSNGCFVGTHKRGPVGVTPITSFQQFALLYGGFVLGQAADDLTYAVWQFFNNGGGVCYIQRVYAGLATATPADDTASLDVLSSESGETPPATLTFHAANPGSWGNKISVQIVASTADPTRFNVFVFYNGVASPVERFSNVTMDPTDQRYFVGIINSQLTGSNYITVTDAGLIAGGATLAHATPLPMDTPTVLTGGTDSVTAVSDDDWVAALAALNVVNSPLNLNLPGITDATTINAALTYANGRGDVFLVIDGESAGDNDGSTATSNQVTLAQTYEADDLSYGAVYFPRVVVSDPASAVIGATKVVAPGGAIMGIIATDDASSGVQQSPAGTNARIANAVGLEVVLASADFDTLAEAQVNAIRTIPGSGICVWGARTLRTDGTAVKFISVRRTLIFVKAQLALLLTPYLFQPNSDVLWQTIDNVATQFLTNFWQSGGLAGDDATAAFYVVCDDTNNTPTSVANGDTNVSVGVAPLTPGEYFNINVAQYNGSVTVAEAA